ISLLNIAIDNYKKKYKITITNKEVQTQIQTKLRQKITIQYLINANLSKLTAQQISKIIIYCKGFYNSDKDIMFKEYKEIIQKAIDNTLITLSDTPDQIPQEIKDILPFELLIKKRYQNI